MWRNRHQAALAWSTLLRKIHDEGKSATKPFIYENDVQVHLIREGEKSPLESFWNGNGTVFIVEKKPFRMEEDNSLNESRTDGSIEDSQKEESFVFEGLHLEHPGSAAVPVMKARQLLSFYSLALNPNMSQLSNGGAVLPPLWVRCDSSDPEGTCWLGAEPLKTSDNRITGICFHTVTCQGPVIGKTIANLEELIKIHKGRHHSTAITTKGFAQYDLYGNATVENSMIESESKVCVDFTWHAVDKTLQIPPLTAAATLNIQVEPGDPRSPVYQVYKELDFLLVLAESLRTGVTEWPEPLETGTAVELVQELLNDLKNKLNGFNSVVPKKETEKVQSDVAAVDSSIQSFLTLTLRGDLDFAEQLWSCMRKSVSSYRDVVDCFALIIQSLKGGDVQPWIHRGSSSSLSKLIQQSYHGRMESVPLSGLTPIHMLIEIGLDKMKRDYINCFIGQELATLNYLEYFISTSVDLQEQVRRVQKLHHMLEIVACCNAFLNLEHENLYPLTQSCLKYYKENPWNVQHVFQLPIRPSFISHFYQTSHPQMWKVELSSGHGQKEVKTVWQVSTKPPVEHVTFSDPDLPLETTILGSSSSEDPLHFITLVSCSQVHVL
ncbi:protein zwilch homolog isoform X2 [Rhinatrema bivittatum]|uniref:protein zwilch homolog isoform X2 n=1 Tax=Rhinatrema bivittatum TaxID=194408 RepID=UPI00112E65AA|nr:protein zwilch homolog isoform X2 [Rhinatrema bivittatum]